MTKPAGVFLTLLLTGAGAFKRRSLWEEVRSLGGHGLDGEIDGFMA